MPDQCPYCQLIDNPEQLLIVGETENFYAWLEVQPRAKGHANVVPKEHVESLMELSPAEWQEAMKLTRETMEEAFEGLDADGISVTMNVEEAGGQMLPHAYIQIFPRFQEDENAGTPTGAIFPHREELQEQSKLQEIRDKMSAVEVNFEEETHEPHPDSKIHEQETSPTEEVKASKDEEEPADEEEEEEYAVKRGESVSWH